MSNWFHVFFLAFKMERPFEFIADITDKKDMWKLAVRVKEKWTVVKDGKEHVEMIIVDAKVIYNRVIHLSFYKVRLLMFKLLSMLGY
jgi:hypothetical protein